MSIHQYMELLEAHAATNSQERLKGRELEVADRTGVDKCLLQVPKMKTENG